MLQSFALQKCLNPVSIFALNSALAPFDLKKYSGEHGFFLSWHGQSIFSVLRKNMSGTSICVLEMFSLTGVLLNSASPFRSPKTAYPDHLPR